MLKSNKKYFKSRENVENISQIFQIAEPCFNPIFVLFTNTVRVNLYV